MQVSRHSERRRDTGTGLRWKGEERRAKTKDRP
jgi:hypothetical protein